MEFFVQTFYFHAKSIKNPENLKIFFFKLRWKRVNVSYVGNIESHTYHLQKNPEKMRQNKHHTYYLVLTLSHEC